ncbi:MAG: CinA family protein [Anaerolineales bacterium]|nr:CinA family protein [Anaerolineales bacterium]
MPKFPEDQLAALLSRKNLTVAAAESCTGGKISDRITNLAGASHYFLGGIVAYSNQAKLSLLGVKEATLHQYGAVSRETALEMAVGARRVFSADLAIAITGIAGPDGGTAEKPGGLTWIGISSQAGTAAVRSLWEGDRLANKHASADAALNLLLETVDQLA